MRNYQAKNERRERARYLVALKGICRHEDGSVQYCRSVDVSSGGALLDLSSKLEVGQTIWLTLNVGSDRLWCQAQVLRSGEAFAGRRFWAAVQFSRVRTLEATFEDAAG